MNSRRILSAGLLFLFVVNPSTALAQGRPSGPCSKLGKVTTISGVKYRCTKSHKKLTWVKSAAPTSQTAKEKVTQTIGIPTAKSVDITAGIYPEVIRSSSHLPVVLTTTTPTICIIQNGAISELQTGTCTVSAIQSGNENFLPADPITFSFDITPPIITSSDSLLDEVQTFVRVPMASTYTSESAEISLTTVVNDDSAEICADDPTTDGCTNINGVGAVDPNSQTRYVKFTFHVKNLDPNPLPTISYRLLLDREIGDVDVRVTLESLNDLIIGSGESGDGSFFAIVPKDIKLDHAFLMIDEGITDSTIRLLFGLSN